MTPRKKEAQRILKAIKEKIGKYEISTMSLLFQCQEIANLLELGDDDTLWIELELQGYPTQHLGSMKNNDEYFKKYGVPHYRIVSQSAVGQMPMETLYPYPLQYQKMPMTVPFYVTSPCGELESSQTPIKLSYDILFDKPRSRSSFSYQESKKIPVTFTATLSVDKMRGISYAIRGRINSFVTAHLTALLFENSASNLFDATRNLLADRLRRLHQPTLDLLNETVAKQESSKDPIEWRDVLEKTRTILRRLTGVLLREEMITEGVSMPSEGETHNKTKMILNWARGKLGENHDREIDYVIAALESLLTRESALIGLINKSGHGEVVDVKRGDVDRILLSAIIWISDMFSLLDIVGFEWDARGNSDK